MSRRPPGDGVLLATLACALLLWAWICLPAIAGSRTFFLRDVFTTHVPYKAFGAAELRHGHIPAFNPTWGLGQPFRGNPNALPFYPGNLLYLALPFWSAFNLHYAAHWLLAFFAMAALARALGLGRAGAWMAALTWAGSGWMLSALTFANVLAVAAWWPLVLLGAVRGGRRGVALGGIACGLALLGGEPVTAALGLVPLLVLAIERHGWRRGAVVAVAIGALGLSIALPQVVAMLRVLPFTFRGSHGVVAGQATEYAFHPWRLLELLLPFPFGRPAWLGRYGVWASTVLPEVPLFFTLYAGIVALALALASVRRRPAWAALAAAGLLLAMIGGTQGELLVRLSLGLFRFPEKLVLWHALMLPLLAGQGLQTVLARASGRWWRLAAAGGALALGLALALRLASSSIVSGVTGGLARLAPESRAAALALLETQLSSWTLALLAAGLALALAAAVVRSGRPWAAGALAALQLATLIQLWPLALTDSTAPYREPAPWTRRLAPPGRGAAVLDEEMLFPPWAPDPVYRVPGGSRIPLQRLTARHLDPAPGVLHGLTYPLATDLEGMQSPPLTLLLYSLPQLGWEQRVHWLRVLGLDAAALFEEPAAPGLRRLDQVEERGVITRLYGVESPAPFAWWPERVERVSGDAEVLRGVGEVPDPIAAVFASGAGEHHSGGRVSVVSAAPDRIELDVEGGGGLAVVRRAYQPLIEARVEGRRLATRPVDLVLLGVEVPPGRHRVVLSVSAVPETVAGAIALLALAAALAVLWRDRRDRIPANFEEETERWL